MKKINYETSDLILRCRGRDGKITRQIKVCGVLEEIKKIENDSKKLNERIAELEQKMHKCLVSKLEFLFLSINSEELDTVTEAERYCLVPLASELFENLVFVFETLKNSYFENEAEKLEFLTRYRLGIISLLYINYVLSKKNEKVKILSEEQTKNLDNLLYLIISLFNEIADKKLESQERISDNQNSDSEYIFASFLDVLCDCLLPNKEYNNCKELKFIFSDISSVEKTIEGNSENELCSW